MKLTVKNLNKLAHKQVPSDKRFIKSIKRFIEKEIESCIKKYPIYCLQHNWSYTIDLSYRNINGIELTSLPNSKEILDKVVESFLKEGSDLLYEVNISELTGTTITVSNPKK